jgi:hypothetical protein
MDKRPMEICILSDLHLGTFGCQAKEVLNYFKKYSAKNAHFKRRYYRHMAV